MESAQIPSEGCPFLQVFQYPVLVLILIVIHALLNEFNSIQQHEVMIKAEFTAIIEPAPEGGYWAICPEVQGANGQGDTIEEAKNSLRKAIELILEDRMNDILCDLPESAIRDKIMVG